MAVPKPTCKKGKPCGFACIPDNHTCTLSPSQIAFLERLVNDATSGKADVIPDNQKKKVIPGLLKQASTDDERLKIAKKVNNRLNPQELAQVLDNEIEPGVTLRKLFNDEPDRLKGKYQFTGMKRQQVSDDEVEAFWNALTPTHQNTLFPTGAGAPDRKGDDYKSWDWDNNNELMRKSMLKAMLEQVDDQGVIRDPWTGQELRFPADLDHIVPLAKKGGHGGKTSTRTTGNANTTLTSENWVWIEPRINRYYKGDTDLYETVGFMLKHEAEGDAAYLKALDDSISKYEAGGAKAKSEAIRDTTKQALEGYFNPDPSKQYPALPDPKDIKEMSGVDAENMMAALRDYRYSDGTKVIDAGTFGKAALTKGGRGTAKAYQRAVSQVYEAIYEDNQIAIARVKAEAVRLQIARTGMPLPDVPQVTKLPSNTSVQRILNNISAESLTPKQQHRVLDKFLSAYDNPAANTSLPDDIQDLYRKALRNPIPRSQLSSSPWSYARASKTYPDITKLEPKDRDKLYDYLRDTFLP